MILVPFSSRERQDSEIAQEIQVKLVFEAEQRRRQEEKDEVTLQRWQNYLYQPF